MHTVSINVLNYNTFEKTKNCIQSCLNQKGIEYSILLIDNCSSDDSFVRLKEMFGDKIDYLSTGDNYGYAKGNNIGIDYCYKKGIKYSLILNSDITINGDTLLSDLVKTIKDNDRCGVVAPYIYNVTSSGLVLNQNDSLYLKLLRAAYILPANHVISDSITSVSEAQGSALLVDNKLFLSVGGFPEHYFMYGEEGCFAKKILWEGKQILWFKDENNYVLHHHDKSKKIDNWRLYLMGRNRAIEYFENKKKAPFRWFIIFHLFILSLKGDNMDSYKKGIKRARNLKKFNASHEQIYLDGKNAKDN